MTNFQALYVIHLIYIHDCSWRALAAHYYNRYHLDGTVKFMNERNYFKLRAFDGNQIDGMYLEEQALKIMRDGK